MHVCKEQESLMDCNIFKQVIDGATREFIHAVLHEWTNAVTVKNVLLTRYLYLQVLNQHYSSILILAFYQKGIGVRQEVI
jgi:hypothetical protein